MDFAVIVTAGERECLKDCLEAVRPQVDHIILIINRSGLDAVGGSATCPPDDIIYESLKPPNLSRMWNLGLDRAKQVAIRADADNWYVAILNDDAIVSPSWFMECKVAMERHRAVASSAGPINLVYTEAGPVPVHLRMQGWAFMLRGPSDIRADERMQWWYADDDLAWRAAEAGGMAMTNAAFATNLFPNGSFTPELHDRAARDRKVFVENWGQAPW